MSEKNTEKKYVNVAFRVPEDTYIAYKVMLLQRNLENRKTPTSDLNAYIQSAILDFEKNSKKIEN